MAEISGRGGQVDLASSQITGINAWTLDYVLEALEVTDFDNGQATDGPRAYVPGLSGWSGTFSGFKDGAPSALSFSAAATLKLYESQTANQFWTGTALITGIHPNVTVDGVVTYSYDFQGSLALTEPTA